MEHSVFISFSSKDHKIAELICEALEDRGIGCWISSRDVKPGENFQAAIVQAIRVTKAMILVFSGNANNSDEIKKEIVLAGQNHLVVIPVRVEDVQPNDALAYEFATRQWVDLFADWEQAMHRLLEQLQTIAGVIPTTGFGEAAPSTAAAHLPRPSLSMVVLPFVNVTGDADQDRLVDAVTQQLTDGLARIEHSFVVPRETALAYHGSTLGEPEIGRQLGVRYVIKGSIRVHEGRLRVNVQLTDVATGESLWVDHFDTAIGRATQQRLAVRWLPELEAQLLAAEGRAPLPEPPPLPASPQPVAAQPQPPPPPVPAPPPQPAPPARPQPARPLPEGGVVIYPRGVAAPTRPTAAPAAQRQSAPFRVPFLVKFAVVAAAGAAAAAMLGADRYSVVEIVSWMFVAAGGIQVLAVVADMAGGD